MGDQPKPLGSDNDEKAVYVDGDEEDGVADTCDACGERHYGWCGE